jgi:hypothetical protein
MHESDGCFRYVLLLEAGLKAILKGLFISSFGYLQLNFSQKPFIFLYKVRENCHFSMKF